MAEPSAKFHLGKLDLVEIVTKNKLTESLTWTKPERSIKFYLDMFIFSHTKSDSHKNYNKIEFKIKVACSISLPHSFHGRGDAAGCGHGYSFQIRKQKQTKVFVKAEKTIIAYSLAFLSLPVLGEEVLSIFFFI